MITKTLELPRTPDFNTYPSNQLITEAVLLTNGVEVTWNDGLKSRFHTLWLRDNCASEHSIKLSTREPIFEIDEVAKNLSIQSVYVDESGSLVIHWQPEDYISRYHPGWLRHYAYDIEGELTPVFKFERKLWDRESLGAVPTFDGPTVLTNPEESAAWIRSIYTTGLGLLRNLPPEQQSSADVAALIGSLRNSSFGLFFHVRADLNRPVADSVAYTNLALPLHTDLATRELQPGVQMLFCLTNDAEGGENIFVDAFRVAEDLRQSEPQIFRNLCETIWEWKYSTNEEDYRVQGPIIVLDRYNQIREVRSITYQRGTLQVPYNQVDACYNALLTWYRRVKESRYQVRFKLQPGDLIAFDNRRILHSRTQFNLNSGSRYLIGCYVDTDDLMSKMRVLSRGQG